MTNRKLAYWMSPPQAAAEFVANMEAVLETYEKPYDPACPVLCMEEQRWVGETGAAPGHRAARPARGLRV
jgi:hypothetical protein